jgi:hypothetical protein
MVVRQDFMEQKQTNKRSPATNIGWHPETLVASILKHWRQKFTSTNR